MKYILFITAVIILITSCGDESSIFDPTYFGDGFKGITFTGYDPTPLKSDPSDWCSLDPIIIDPDSNVITPLVLRFGPAFPNPINLGSSTTIPFAIPQDLFVKLYVIDKDYNVIKTLINNILPAGNYQIRFDSNAIGSTGVYRVVFKGENIYCKGDIWIRK